MRRFLTLVLLVLGGAAAAAVEESTIAAVPGLGELGLTLPPAWHVVAPAPPGAVLVVAGPFEPSTMADVLTPRPVMALAVTVADGGETGSTLVTAALAECQRLLTDFALDPHADIQRTVGGRRWCCLRFSFSMAQQACLEELWLAVVPTPEGARVVRVACSCAPDRFSAYAPVFEQIIGSLGSSRAQVLPPRRRR